MVAWLGGIAHKCVARHHQRRKPRVVSPTVLIGKA